MCQIFILKIVKTQRVTSLQHACNNVGYGRGIFRKRLFYFTYFILETPIKSFITMLNLFAISINVKG